MNGNSHKQKDGASLGKPFLRSHSLTALLDEEWFLLRVFEHLLDYGLENCRLVCWKWYEACQHFPVKFKNVAREQLGDIAEAFPNTVEVSVELPDMLVSGVQFFECLPSLHNLKVLRFGAVLFFPGGNHLYFQSLPQLTELAVGVDCVGHAEDMVASLKYLTNLTKLSAGWARLAHPAAEPFVGLRKIRELNIDFDFFTDDRGTCYFPSLTNLTRLELSMFLGNQPRTLPFEAISLYASSLQYLGLTCYTNSPRIETLEGNFVLLESLKKLSTFTFGQSFAYLEGFWETLMQLQSITKLTRLDVGNMRRILGETLVALTGLKAIEFEGFGLHNRNARDIALVSKMTHLTELTAPIEGQVLSKLSCLTQLVRLRLEVESEHTWNLNEALSCMIKLESLEIEFCGYHIRKDNFGPYASLTLSSSAFKDMVQLKLMSLALVDVDKLFFQQLASTAQLTKLEFTSLPKRTYPQSFLSQVNLLSNLEELKMDVDITCNVGKLLSPQHLTKLKKLNAYQLEKQQVTVLRKRFACLGQVLVNQSRSAWQID